MSILNNRTILITGVMGVLGQAVAKQAKRQGATVHGVDVIAKADAASNSVDHIDHYHQVDLLDRNAVAHCLSQLEHLSGLINVAGGFNMGGRADDLDSPDWDKMFALNVDTLRHAVAAAVPLLAENQHAAIVNIGALGALSGQANMSAYCCSKSVVMRLTESLSAELKGRGVNVNAVLPSIIDTPQNRQAMPDADFSNWVSPEKLASTICFLMSDAASDIHGALLPVTGLV